MKMTSARGVITVLVAIVVSALPALANIITSANAKENCTQYQLNISGVLLTPPTATVSYTITLTPGTGSAITINDTMTVTKTNSSGNFSGSTTQSWSKYGVTLNTAYTLSGTATLNTSDGNTVKIAFSPNPLNCTLVPTLTTANSSITCSGYTLNVAGINLTAPSTVAYTIVLTPTTGSTITATGTIAVTPVSGNFTGSASGTWSATPNGTYTASGSAKLAGENTLAITFSPPTLVCTVTSACTPSSSSLSILTQSNKVSAYVPNGNWAAPSTQTGVQVVGLEPTAGALGAVSGVTDVINSCGSNSTTGQTVCVANNTDIYLINGLTANSPIASQANTKASFSGGMCNNCGVNINPATNTAAITIGYKSAPSGSAIELLSLANTSSYQIVPAAHEVSEDILWDPSRNLILSPDEEGYYELFQTPSSGTVTEYSNNLKFGDGDTAAEDCSTGIALSSLEYTSNIYITDLTQATFTSGNPGTWSAPGQIQNFPDFNFWGQSKATGIAVAGGSHLAIVTTEFYGDYFGAIQLPATSGSGTPAIVDYVSAQLPHTPDGNTWHNGWDPHTSTAYVSPNNGKAYGVMADAAPPTYVAIIDLQALLAAPRTAGTHTVELTYDLVANGVVTFVPTH